MLFVRIHVLRSETGWLRELWGTGHFEQCRAANESLVLIVEHRGDH